MTNNFEEYALMEGDNPLLFEAVVHLQSVFRGHAARTRLKKRKRNRNVDTGRSSSSQNGDELSNKALSSLTKEKEISSGNEESGNEDLTDEDETLPMRKKHGLPSMQESTTDSINVNRSEGHSTDTSASIPSGVKHADNTNGNSEPRAWVLRIGRGRPKGSLNRKSLEARRKAKERLMREEAIAKGAA